MDQIVNKSFEELDAEAGISANMDPLLDFTGQMGELNSTLTQVQDNATALQAQVDNLSTNLTVLKRDIVSLISKNCSEEVCTEMVDNVKNVNVSVDYTSIQTGYVTTIPILEKAAEDGLDGKLRNGYDEFKAIPGNVSKDVSDDINDAREEADNVAAEITRELDNVVDDIGDVDFAGVGHDMREVSDDDMEFAASVTFWSLAGLAGVVALIVLLTYMGLLCGCCPRANRKSDYCCTKKVGATFLLAAVGITFLLYWVFILVLIPLFLFGGLTQTEICRHLVALDESPVSEITNDLVNASLADAGFSINITQVYSSCKQNKAFYVALDVENTFGFDLDTMLDTTEIDTMIENIKTQEITLGDIPIVPQDVFDGLIFVGDAVHNASGDTDDYLEELSKDVTSQNLASLADVLENFTSIKQIPGLTDSIAELNLLYTDATDIDLQREATHTQLEWAQELLSTNITGLATNLQMGQDIANDEGEAIIEDVLNNTATEVSEIIDTSVEKIEDNVRNKIGECRPVYEAVVKTVDAGCVELLYAVNGYWFALGWSVFFLLIGIFISLKLVTLYRKTLDFDAVDPAERRARRRPPPKADRHPNNDTTVLIVRREPNSHEMTPINNPVYTTDSNRIPRPQIKYEKSAYPQESTKFMEAPPRYSPY